MSDILTQVIIHLEDETQHDLIKDRLQDGLSRLPGAFYVKGITSGRDMSRLEFLVECRDCPEREAYINYLLDNFPSYRQLGRERLAHRYIEQAAKDIADVPSGDIQAGPA
jgi:hypothetical protein